MSKIIAVFAMALAILTSGHPAEAQQAGKMPRIGYLSFSAGPIAADEAFRQGLRDLGWIEGQNIVIDYRWAAGKRDRYPALVEELVGLKVDIIVSAAGASGVRAAKKATSTIPIVMVVAADAVENGLVASLARPGGNVTGMTEQYSEINMKLLELLHETLPKVTRVGFLWTSGSQVYLRTFRAAQAVAPALGLKIQSLALRHPKEIDSMLEAAAQERAGALLVMGRMYITFGRRIAEFAAKNRVPVFSIRSPSVEKHIGLLAYAPDRIDTFRRAATYVDKILKGAKPSDLPVQRAAKFNLVVNLKTANQLGITIPPNILYQATKVIK